MMIICVLFLLYCILFCVCGSMVCVVILVMNFVFFDFGVLMILMIFFV